MNLFPTSCLRRFIVLPVDDDFGQIREHVLSRLVWLIEKRVRLDSQQPDVERLVDHEYELIDLECILPRVLEFLLVDFVE